MHGKISHTAVRLPLCPNILPNVVTCALESHLYSH
jgi:hypothetical protein